MTQADETILGLLAAVHRGESAAVAMLADELRDQDRVDDATWVQAESPLYSDSVTVPDGAAIVRAEFFASGLTLPQTCELQVQSRFGAGHPWLSLLATSFVPPSALTLHSVEEFRRAKAARLFAGHLEGTINLHLEFTEGRWVESSWDAQTAIACYCRRVVERFAAACSCTWLMGAAPGCAGCRGCGGRGLVLKTVRPQ